MKKRKLVICGFGDVGLQVAIHLAGYADEVEVVGITPKPCHHSMQELGGRLSQPSLWQQLYFLPFSAYVLFPAVRPAGRQPEPGTAAQCQTESRVALRDGYDVRLSLTVSRTPV